MPVVSKLGEGYKFEGSNKTVTETCYSNGYKPSQLCEPLIWDFAILTTLKFRENKDENTKSFYTLKLKTLNLGKVKAMYVPTMTESVCAVMTIMHHLA